MAVHHGDEGRLAGRRAFHPVTPAAVLLVLAVAGAVHAAATAGGSMLVTWWLLLGLVSGYAISGSV